MRQAIIEIEESFAETVNDALTGKAVNEELIGLAIWNDEIFFMDGAKIEIAVIQEKEKAYIDAMLFDEQGCASDIKDFTGENIEGIFSFSSWYTKKEYQLHIVANKEQ